MIVLEISLDVGHLKISCKSDFKLIIFRYAADKILGAPNFFPKYGDHKGTWAQKTLTAKEFIVVNKKS